MNANTIYIGKITVSDSTVAPHSLDCNSLWETGHENLQRTKLKRLHCQNMQDSPNVMLTGECTALDTYIEKEDWPPIDKLSFHITKPEKEETIKPTQAERRKS